MTSFVCVVVGNPTAASMTEMAASIELGIIIEIGAANTKVDNNHKERVEVSMIGKKKVDKSSEDERDPRANSTKAKNLLGS